MAITINGLIEEMRDYFQLQYLAGQDGGEHVVTWVSLMEDISVAELFVGNELVVTSGYAARDEESQLAFVEALNRRPIAGLVINTGKYIMKVPKSVVELCDRYRIPLITMPWEINAMEFVKSCCGRIEENTRETERLNDAAMMAIQSPYNESAYITELSEYFDEGAGFQILAVSMEIPDESRRRELNRAELRIHTALYRWGMLFLVFKMEQRFILVLNQKDRKTGDEVAQHVVDVYLYRGGDVSDIHVGVGEPVDDIRSLSNSYHTAISAIRRAAKINRTILRFADMGFYKLLYSVPDDGILKGYYEQRMAPLLEYDKAHDTQYVETLFRYLLNDCSLSAVAEEMYTHRNTVNYRMGKIRELMGNPLDSQRDRFPLVLAFHIGVILDLIPDYEIDSVRRALAKEKAKQEQI